jgi:hypothetical protein
VDETFSLQGGQLLAAARLLNKTRQVFAMSVIKSFETPDRLEDLALLGLQKTHQAIARRQIYFDCKSPFPSVFTGIPRHKACCPAVELTVTTLSAGSKTCASLPPGR